MQDETSCFLRVLPPPIFLVVNATYNCAVGKPSDTGVFIVSVFQAQGDVLSENDNMAGSLSLLCVVKRCGRPPGHLAVLEEIRCRYGVRRHVGMLETNMTTVTSEGHLHMLACQLLLVIRGSDDHPKSFISG